MNYGTIVVHINYMPCVVRKLDSQWKTTDCARKFFELYIVKGSDIIFRIRRLMLT